MSLLSETIDEHLRQNFIGFHSPAHCGKLNPRDLSELDGLDDLQYPQSILKESQDFVANLFGAQASFFLINGASIGMHAACLALKIHLNSINDSRSVLVARNVHKSTIAGIILAGLKIEWLEPNWDEELGIFTTVDSGLARNDVSALIITNPTYEGFYSEIPALNIPLIVDEAHGAHFHFSDQVPKPGLEYGADIVVQSWHKTLGSLTQTGVLHLGKFSKIKGKYLADSLRLLQSTSPSYLLLESLCKTAELYAKEGRGIIERTIELSKKITSPFRVKNHDPLKLVLCCPGNKMEEFLSSKNILIEASGQNYALAFINPFNNEEDILKLQEALDQFTYDQNLARIPRLVFFQQNLDPREAFFNGDTEIYAPCPPGIALRVPGQKASID